MNTCFDYLKFVTGIAVLVVVSGAHAQDSSPLTETPRGDLINTSNEENEGKGLLLIVSRLPLAASDPKATDGWSKLTKLTDDPNIFCRKEGLEGLDPDNSSSLKFKLMDLQKEQFFPCSNSRLLAGEGETMRVVFVEKAQNPVKAGDGMQCANKINLPALDPKEIEREPLLAIQIRQLITVIGDKATLSSKKPEAAYTKAEYGLCAWEWSHYKFKLKRADVKVATIDPVPVEFRVISGPAEHVFLSVDGTVKGASQLKYEVGSKTIALKDKPEQLYLGVNYMWGDLYGALPKLDPRRLVLKALVTPNQQMESIGLGIGYRLPGTVFGTGKIDSKDNSGFVLFVGRFWTKGEKLVGDVPTADSRREASTRFGISYSFGTALDWLTPKK